jgi:hypothetical protein
VRSAGVSCGRKKCIGLVSKELFSLDTDTYTPSKQSGAYTSKKLYRF